MNHVYITPNRLFFKGIKKNESHAFYGGKNVSYRNRLFWLSKNSTIAAGYGNVAAYVPIRRLKLLKLNYATIKKLFQDPKINTNLKEQLALSWGEPGKTYLNQFKARCKKVEHTYSTFEKRYRWSINIWNPVTKQCNHIPLTEAKNVWENTQGKPKPAGRISHSITNISTYELLRKQFAGTYDGIWSPTLRSSWHGRFPEEIVIFNPKLLKKVEYSSLNENLRRKNIAEGIEYRKREARKRKPSPIEGPGTRLYAPARRLNSPRTVASKRLERTRVTPLLYGPGKSFFKTNSPVLNANALRYLFRR